MGGARRREHVRGRGAAIVGTSGEWRSAVAGVGKRAQKRSQAEGQQRMQASSISKRHAGAPRLLPFPRALWQARED